MAVTSLPTYCANCGAEELLARIEAAVCPFCQLSFCEDDSFQGKTLGADASDRLPVRLGATSDGAGMKEE